MTYEGFFIGIVLALLYSEWMDILPGGIIVPAFMALYLDQPARIAATLAVAFLALFSYRVLSTKMILFGRRRFVLLILLGTAWAFLLSLISPQWIAAGEGIRAIGWIVPGLLANNLEKQKYLPTLASLFTVSIMTFFVVKLMAYIGI